MGFKKTFALISVVSVIAGYCGICSTNSGGPKKAVKDEVIVSDSVETNTEENDKQEIASREDVFDIASEVNEDVQTERKTSNVASSSNTSSNQQSSNQKEVSSNNQATSTNPNSNSSIVEKPSNSAVGTKPEEKPAPPEVVKPQEEVKNYQTGNCGVLYNTESDAYAAAEIKFNDFSDPSRYVSSYLVYSTYDKWSINYYYTYW